MGGDGAGRPAELFVLAVAPVEQGDDRVVKEGAGGGDGDGADADDLAAFTGFDVATG